jgi:hypothetical protein
MSTPHKWADVIKAMADGKAVQRMSHEGIWLDFKEGMSTPFCVPDLQWRIKPEPKKDVVAYVGFAQDGDSRVRLACISAESVINTVKVVLDGETGLLKSAEVVK